MSHTDRRVGSRFRAVPRGAVLAGLLALTACSARVARADATAGFVEHWSSSAFAGWGGGSSYSNPGTGGALGAGDGFLIISNATPFNLGAKSSGPNYTGDWRAAGIGKVQFSLKDVGNPDPLEIHFTLGSQSTFYQCNTGFVPTSDWSTFTVDLSDTANFTRIIGVGTFSSAITAVDRVLIRHDVSPFVQSPDPIAADFGLDEFTFVAGSTGVPLSGPAVALPIELAPPYPNPSRGPVALSLQSHDASAITIQVVDVSGRLIRRATLAAASPGPRLWTWDGRSDAGDVAPAGYYRVRAFSAAGGTSQPLVRLAGAR